VGRGKRENKTFVSPQSIYSHIKKDKEESGSLYKCLRYQGRKYKWMGFSKDRTRIPNRKDISERPKIVSKKKRYGDWETDLVVSGRDGSGAIATFAERRSLFCNARKVCDRSSDEMVRASEEVFAHLPKRMKRTMTHDNGKEISQHELITERIGIHVYCSRPYKSCDRGLNEWMNRELRRFFPKKTDFSLVSQDQIDSVVLWLNNCPRKSLSYFTPNEVFLKTALNYAF
jgi:transposase, IS30 family